MRAGKLTNTITIERLVEALDDYGVKRQAWTPIATVKAEIVTSSTQEFLRTAGESAESVIVFRIRYMENVTPADRVVHAGVTHDVKEVRLIGRRHGLELRTKGASS